MFYENFEDHITAKYGLVIEGWPLDKIISPGAINSRPELTVLLNAWKTGVARFRRLAPEEVGPYILNVKKQREQNGGLAAGVSTRTGPQAPSSGEGSSQPNDGQGEINQNEQSAPLSAVDAIVSTEENPLSGAVPVPVPPTTAASGSNFVMDTVSGIVAVPKKRKQRSDKGKSRGPNKRSGKH